MDNLIHKRANFIRYSYIENMGNHLLAFENKLLSNGIDVKWIMNEDELVSFIKSSFAKNFYNKVCFDVSHFPEELQNGANNLIKEVSFEDLDNNSAAADYLIADANFGLVDTGSVVLFNHKSKNCFNKVDHLIFILDINNLIVKSSDLGIILSLYEKEMIQGNQKSVNIISQPFDRIVANNNQFDQSNSYSTQKVDITVLLYNNGITDTLKNEKLRESLYCIKCGKCKQVCPIYQLNHKHSPIDLLKNNSFATNTKNSDIFESTTLCGNCDKVCPVLIPFTRLFISEMEAITSHDHNSAWQDFGKANTKRIKINKLNGKIRRYFLNKKLFKNNKKLLNYYMSQQEDFYNLTKSKAEENAN